MLAIPGQPFLDKQRLIGRCVRLPLACDLARLQAEVAALPELAQATRAGRIRVHNPASAVFLRGHAPAAGDLPIEDREALAHLPYVRELIGSLIPAPPMRCLLATLPGGAVILPHTDRPAYFAQTLRIHVPVVTHPRVWVYCDGLSYQMAPGEVWALNNSVLHAVWNADPQLPRTHLICDFLPSPALIELLLAGERELGIDRPEVYQHLVAASQASDL
jgi:hypothetical protein